MDGKERKPRKHVYRHQVYDQLQDGKAVASKDDVSGSRGRLGTTLSWPDSTDVDPYNHSPPGTLETTSNRCASLSMRRSRSSVPITSTSSTCTGGTGLARLRKLWTVSTTLSFRARSSTSASRTLLPGLSPKPTCTLVCLARHRSLFTRGRGACCNAILSVKSSRWHGLKVIICSFAG